MAPADGVHLFPISYRRIGELASSVFVDERRWAGPHLCKLAPQLRCGIFWAAIRVRQMHRHVGINTLCFFCEGELDGARRHLVGPIRSHGVNRRMDEAAF